MASDAATSNVTTSGAMASRAQVRGQSRLRPELPRRPKTRMALQGNRTGAHQWEACLRLPQERSLTRRAIRTRARTAARSGPGHRR